MAQVLSPGKSACILAVVVGCFAILWPSIFYPMLKGSVFPSRNDKNEYHRQEQSHNLRPNAIHPTIREHGRAIPQPHSAPPPSRERRSVPPPAIAAKKPPIPGLRPPMTGGHVPSQKDNGPMGILMPLYTVGIVIFFVYTITKLVCKKHDNNTQFTHDPEFHRQVLQKNAKESKQTTNKKSRGGISPDTSKLGDIELNLLRKRLVETEATLERIVKQMTSVSQSLSNPQKEDSSSDKPLVSEPKEEESNDECAERRAIAENGQSKHKDYEGNDLTQVRKVEMDESCAGEQSRKHPSVESAEESSIPKNDHEKIVNDELTLPASEPDSKTSITDASITEAPGEPSIILESKTTLVQITNDWSHREADANNAEVIKEDMNNKNEENYSENNEGESSEQDPSEKEAIPTTEL